jgi:hypothetical protein
VGLWDLGGLVAGVGRRSDSIPVIEAEVQEVVVEVYIILLYSTISPTYPIFISNYLKNP